MSAIAVLSPIDARVLTDEVKHDAEALWAKLLDLYNGDAHGALGYSSWRSYFEAEFGQSGAHGYRLLQAARVRELLPSHTRVTGRQATALAPLLDEPDELRAAWAQASANGQPTQIQVREAVEQRRPRLTVPLDEELLARQQRETLIQQLDRAVYSLEGPPSTAEAEARRLLVEGDPGPFTPSRFDRVSEYATAFARTLREAGIDG